MTRAALLMIVGMALIPLGDSAGKLLIEGRGVSPIFVAWTRFALGAMLLVPFLAGGRFVPHVLLNWRVILRGLLIMCGILSILTALKTEPLPNVFAAFFVGPIVSYVLSILLLGERVTLWRSVLLGIGFCGVLLVVRPGFGMTAGLGFAVLAGIFYGGYLVASRWLAEVAPSRMLLFAQLVTGAVILTPPGIAAVPPVNVAVVGLLTLSAAASMAGNLLLLMAYRLAPATRLAPLVYFQLIAATAFGWVIFGDWPDTVALAGLALLVSSGFAALALRR